MPIVITLGIDRLRTVEFNGSSAEREIEIALWRHLLPLVDRIDTKLRQIHAKVERELKRDERAERTEAAR
jgi:hypothetical protein